MDLPLDRAQTQWSQPQLFIPGHPSVVLAVRWHLDGSTSKIMVGYDVTKTTGRHRTLAAGLMWAEEPVWRRSTLQIHEELLEIARTHLRPF